MDVILDLFHWGVVQYMDLFDSIIFCQLEIFEKALLILWGGFAFNWII